MKLTNQKNMACLPTSIFMLNENKDYGKIKKLCQKRFGHSVLQRKGCDVKNIDDLVGMLKDLGFKNPAAVTKGTFRTLTTLTLYRRALLMPYDPEKNIGHAVAWDGYRILDPSQSLPMTGKQFLKEYEGCTYMVILLETSFIKRLMNVFKQPFFIIWNS